MLGNAIFDFVGVGESSVAIETDKIRKVVNTGHVAIGKVRLDGVLVAMTSLRAIEKTFQSGWAEFHRKFAGVTGDGIAGDDAVGVQRIAVEGGAKGRGGGDAKR